MLSLLLRKLSKLSFSVFSIVFAWSSVVWASPLFYALPTPQGKADVRFTSVVSSQGQGIWLLDQQGRPFHYDGIHYQALAQFTDSALPAVDKLISYAGTLWLLSDSTLQRFSHDTNQLESVFFPAPVFDIARGANTLWVSTQAGLHRIQEGGTPLKVNGRQYQQLFGDEKAPLGISDGAIFQPEQGRLLASLAHTEVLSAKLSSERLWLGTRDGLWAYRDGQAETQHLASLSVFDVAINREGIWAATSQGLYFAAAVGSEPVVFTPVADQGSGPNSLSGRAVYDLDVTDSGDLWVVTDSGLNYRRPLFSGISRTSRSDLEPILGNALVSKMLRRNEGVILAAKNTLLQLDSSLKVSRSLRLSASVESMALLDDTLWVGTASGLHAVSADTLERKKTVIPESLRTLVIDSVQSDNNSLWVSSGPLLYRYWPTSDTLVNFGDDWTGEGQTSLLSLLDLGESGIWLGTNTGLYTYYDGRFVRRLSSAYIGAVTAIQHGQDGTLWLITERGAYTFDPQMGQGLATWFANRYGEVLSCVAVGADSVFFISNKGLYRQSVGGKSLQYTPILQQSDFHQVPRYSCASDLETIAIADHRGVTSLPHTLANRLLEDVQHAPTLGAVYLNGKPWRIGLASSDLITVPGPVSLVVEVGQLPLRQFDQLMYRLDSGDTLEWHATRDNRLVFSTIEPGSYTLSIKLKEGATETPEFELLTIRVDPPWYEKTGIGLLLVLAILLFVISYYKQKHAQVRSQNRRLRKTVHKKVAEIDRWHAIEESGESSPPAAYQGPNTVAAEPDTAQEQESEVWRTAAMKDIQRHFHDPDYALSDLARTLYLSERSLQRRFRAEFNSTFKDVLIATRLESAKRMLCQGDRIADVAVSCGFNEPSYFAKCFKARFGSTPSRFRERCGEEEKKSVV